MEGASHGSSILKLYNKWHEKLMGEEVTEEENVRVSTNHANKEKKGILSKVKASIQSGGKDKKVRYVCALKASLQKCVCVLEHMSS